MVNTKKYNTKYTKKNKQSNYLPDWLNDETMKNAKNDTISVNEEQFWIDLIAKYLTPLDRNEAEEV